MQGNIVTLCVLALHKARQCLATRMFDPRSPSCFARLRNMRTWWLRVIIFAHQLDIFDSFYCINDRIGGHWSNGLCDRGTLRCNLTSVDRYQASLNASVALVESDVTQALLLAFEWGYQ